MYIENLVIEIGIIRLRLNYLCELKKMRSKFGFESKTQNDKWDPNPYQNISDSSTSVVDSKSNCFLSKIGIIQFIGQLG